MKFIVNGGLNSPLGTALLEASGIDPNMVRRLVLDLSVGDAGKMYVETFADSAILEVGLPTGITIQEST